MMPKILVIGDVMLDKFSYGNVKRLNPESPNPLLNIEKEEHRLGGAANVAANVASLTNNVDLIGVVGDDQQGRIFGDLCVRNNINLYSLTNAFPTITKQRFIETTYKQQLLRVDYEEKVELDIQHKEEMYTKIIQLQPEFMIISDYNKGTIGEDVITRLKEIGEEYDIKILADAKPKNSEYFKNIYLVKPNFKEFCGIINKGLENTDENIEKYGRMFVEEYKTNLVVTRGKYGASLVTQGGNVLHITTESKEVFDVTGAGDTFMATLTTALQKGHSLEGAVQLANKASGIVIGKIGTARIKQTELPDL